MRSRFLPSLLIALLAGTSVPAWSVQSQAGHTGSLACVQACALGEALMTHNGRLSAVGTGQCWVRSQNPATTLRVDAVKVSRLAGAASGPSLARALPALLPAFSLGYRRRGPPAYGGFLWSQHPSAQAPPTL